MTEAITERRRKAQEYWAQKRSQGQVEPDQGFEAILEGPPPEPVREPEPPPPEPTYDPLLGLTPPKPLVQQSKAVQARWAGEHAADTDLRTFFEQLPLPKAFVVYAKMRSNLETVGKLLNARVNLPEEQYCKTCERSLADLGANAKRGWFLDRPHYRNGDRNIIDVDHFCSAACLSLENNRTQGVYGLSDRGMLPHDNPRNHPRLNPALKPNGKE
jgi:hypothetical protein